MESWERIVDRDEIKNLNFYSPKEFVIPTDDKINLSLKRDKVVESTTQKPDQEEKVSDVVPGSFNPYIDTDYA